MLFNRAVLNDIPKQTIFSTLELKGRILSIPCLYPILKQDTEWRLKSSVRRPVNSRASDIRDILLASCQKIAAECQE